MPRGLCDLLVHFLPFSLLHFSSARRRGQLGFRTRPGGIRGRQLGYTGLASVLFFTVSGGPYGLEPLVASLSPGRAVLLVVVVPIVWALPIALMVAELSSALPEEGGYYVWVKRALGPFWAVQEGWWSICAGAVDLALYPVLFVDYLAYFFPALALDAPGAMSISTLLLRWSVALTVIGTSLVVNRRGIRPVGHSAALSLASVVAPFALLVVWSLTRPGHASAAWSAATGGLRAPVDLGALAIGFSVVLWNYSGWDNVGTFAREVENPERNYPTAIALTLPLIIAIYLLPLLAGLAVTTERAAWDESAGWPVIAHAVGGAPLGTLLAGAALVSAWSLFNSCLLSFSRLPYVMAEDGWLPRRLARVSDERAIPTTALTTSCLITALLAAFTFQTLIVVDVLLYSAALMLEFGALIVLRRRAPDLPRPFRIPGGWPALLIVTAGPVLCGTVIAAAATRDALSGPTQLVITAAAALSGVVLYYLRR